MPLRQLAAGRHKRLDDLDESLRIAAVPSLPDGDPGHITVLVPHPRASPALQE